MEYRNRGVMEAAVWVMLRALLWVGVAGIAWDLLKPGGWLFQFIGLVMDNQPTSIYYLTVGVLGLLAGKYWLDEMNPNASLHFLVFTCAFAGSYFILRLVLPL